MKNSKEEKIREKEAKRMRVEEVRKERKRRDEAGNRVEG